MQDGWIREGQGFVLVYSITKEDTFYEIKKIQKKIERVKGGMSNVSVIIVGNKIDLEKDRVITTEQGKTLANEMGCLFLETSAKNGINCDEVYKLLVQEILKKTSKQHQKQNKKKGFFQNYCSLI